MRRILIIDDEQVVREALALMLRQEGWHVVAAECGHAGLDAIAAFAFDLVIIDIFMPGMTGIETIHVLREDAPDLPVIVMSGQVGGPEGMEFLAEARAAGATHFVPKPVMRQELNEAIARCGLSVALVA